MFVLLTQVASINDKADFRTVNDAMRAIGFKREHIDTLWRMVAGILHLVRHARARTCRRHRRATTRY